MIQEKKVNYKVCVVEESSRTGRKSKIEVFERKEYEIVDVLFIRAYSFTFYRTSWPFCSSEWLCKVVC